MSDELTRRRTLESLKKEAKQWLDALRQNAADARSRLQRALPNAPTSPTLRDVQHALAREQGFQGWTELKQQLDARAALSASTIRQFNSQAEALLEAYRTGTPEAMERHWALTWHRRSWQAMRTYVQLDIGRQVGSANLDDDITLDDARYLVARQHGFDRWELLVQACATLPVPPSAAPPPRMTDAMVEELCHREPLLTEIDLSGSHITDRALAILGTLPTLEIVSLTGTAVTDAGVRHLAKCERLREVNLQGTSTGDGALRALAGKANLSQLRTGNSVTDAGLAALHEFPVFKRWQGGEPVMSLLSYDAAPNYLLLRGSFGDRGMGQLAGLDGLFGLNLDASELNISAAALMPLTTLPRLGWLACVATDAHMPYVASMPSLRFLGCQDTVAGDEGFVALSASRSIEYVWGRRCHNLRTRGFRALAAMPALKGLSVSCKNVDDEGVAALPGFPALKELMPMDIPDAGYRHIGRCSGLESLVLMYCRDTGDAATEQITELPALTRYFASYTRITDRTPELLSTMATLESVILDSCAGVTDAGIAHLARLPHIKELRVTKVSR